MATLLLSVMGAFAEFERALIRERQREGIALAKRRGAYRGRKKALSTARAEELIQRVQAGEAKAPLARELGISRETLYQSVSARNAHVDRHVGALSHKIHASPLCVHRCLRLSLCTAASENT
jgi:DNA invertase Pin-like site-specific DNA recombinase